MGRIVTQKAIDSANENLCDLYINGQLAVVGRSTALNAPLQLKPYAGNIINNAGFYNLGLWVEMEVINNIASINYKTTYDFEDMIFSVNMEAPEIYESELGSSGIESAKAGNCTLYINDSVGVEGQLVYEGDSIRLVPFAGWELKAAGYYSDGVYRRFEIVENVGILPFSRSTNIVEMDLEITSEQNSPGVVGFNNVYQPSLDEMIDINKERFIHKPDRDVEDYGNYILSLLSIPFKIPEEYYLESENVILGDFSIPSKAKKLSSDLLVFDMGKISIPKTEYNSLDYIGKQAILYLPNSESIIMDLNDVIGWEVSITYELNVYSGVCTVNIVSSNVDSTVITKQVDMGFNIPFIDVASNTPNNINISVSGINNITQPFIAIVSKELILAKGFFTTPAIVEGTIKDLKGFIKVDNIDLKISDTNNIKSMIESILSTGVIIK